MASSFQKIAQYTGMEFVETTSVPLEKIVTARYSAFSAMDDLEFGRASHTPGPVDVLYLEDEDKYLLFDGNHRLIATMLKGENSISANVYIGYSDIWATPSIDERLEIDTSLRFKGLEDLADEEILEEIKIGANMDYLKKAIGQLEEYDKPSMTVIDEDVNIDVNKEYKLLAFRPKIYIPMPKDTTEYHFSRYVKIVPAKIKIRTGKNFQTKTGSQGSVLELAYPAKSMRQKIGEAISAIESVLDEEGLEWEPIKSCKVWVTNKLLDGKIEVAHLGVTKNFLSILGSGKNTFSGREISKYVDENEVLESSSEIPEMLRNW